MRFAPAVLLSMLACGCGSNNDSTCSAPVTCAGGSYRVCLSGGPTSCSGAHYETSDGKTFACQQCTCADAAGAISAWCGGQAVGDLGGPTGGRTICDRYLTCAAATTPATFPSLQQGYGTNGTCWQTPAASQQMCLDACQAGLTQLQNVSGGNPACGCGVDSDCSAGTFCHSSTQQCEANVCTTGNTCGCNSYRQCNRACGSEACRQQCAKYSTDQALNLFFQVYWGCPMRYCNRNGIVCTSADLDPNQSAPVSTNCRLCVDKLELDEEAWTAANCQSELAACAADTP